MSKLALLGGTAAIARDARAVTWPVITEDERKAVLGVLDSGELVSNSDGETAVSELERRWAQHVGVGHCIGVANGTVALSLALAGLGIGPGDEVIVPAFSFIASGLAPLHQMAVPVFVDIDPVTFTIDCDQIAAAITSRTAAILPVHLHGLPADMDAITAIAERRGLAVLEDAAQAHGATYRGREVGSLGTAGAFSLQVTKNLPTCGEGGLITTDDGVLAARTRMARQFGEVIEPGRARDYVSYSLGWNAKLNPVQAAFTLAQLDRFADYERARQVNVAALLARLDRLPGIQVPTTPPDRSHAWHILRFRFDPRAAGLPDGVTPAGMRVALRRVLRAEGVPLSQYQLMPLPDQKVFVERIGFGRGYPWTASTDAPPDGEYPVSHAVIDDSLTIQKRHLHPDAGPLLASYADAFEKAWEHLDVVAQLARAAS